MCPRFAVTAQKEAELSERLDGLGISEQDLVEQFIRGAGKGGQKINKTSSTVYIKHLPTGIEIKCQQTRSQSLNRYYARQELCERIENRLNFEEVERKKRQAKIRRQNRPRTRKAKANILANKKHQSASKVGRRKVDPSGD